MDVDWVTARARCSVAGLFVRLLTAVRHDVDTRNALRLPEHPATFEVIEADQEFTVVRNNGDTRRVRFEHDASGVRAHYGTRILFYATFRFNRSAECVFVIENEEVEDWYLRQLALQKLFFERPSA